MGPRSEVMGLARAGSEDAALLLRMLLLSLAALLTSRVHAQVIEPNGLAVPITAAGSNEQSVQSYFDGRMPPEPIDALREASAEPATFSPRCGFEAELVLSQSSAPAGLAWYNVPSDETSAPSEIYAILAETTMPGAIISSSQIRSDSHYAGGLVGFALTKFGGKAIYYSEASRNPECTSCATPGHWKLMLAYPSHLESTAYFLAWEDWEGANESSWPDDGDFNDKVFRLSGVRCAGGGEPCDTGKPGVCAQGLTGCSSGTAPGECAPLEAASPEVCDGLDNDCDGVIDDDHPCGTGAVCVNGSCTSGCGGAEFGCDPGLACDDGQCVDSACVGMHCDAGKVCQQGRCLAACDDVVCPLGQLCRSGVCKDPCAAVSCKAGSVCREGACLESCQCSGCKAGLSCDGSTGSCVDPGCEGKVCPAGSACSQGACVDACQNAHCPRGASCQNGQCDGSQQIARPATGMQTNADSGTVIPIDGAVAGGNASSAGTGNAVASAGSAAPARATAAHGCSCQLAQRTAPPLWAAWVLLALVAGWRSARRQNRSR
jgi:MYXO-CTERM domain-containing protein